MTRQEYEAKQSNRTLTIGDVLENPEFATPEQVESIAAPQLLRVIRESGRPDAEALRCVGKMLGERFAEVNEDLAAMSWERLNSDNDGNACNTDCPAFVRGSCPFDPRHKSDCPRYREYYPRR